MQTTYTTQARTNTQKAVSVALWLAKALWSTTCVVAYVLYSFVMAVLILLSAVSRNTDNEESQPASHALGYKGDDEFFGEFWNQ